MRVTWGSEEAGNWHVVSRFQISIRQQTHAFWERTMQAANSSRTRPSTEDIQPQQPLTEGEFWLAFLMQLSQLLLIFHKAVIHVNKMSAHFYHPRLTTGLGKMGEQPICWLKLQYYTNVPTFISWLTSERRLADHCLPRPPPSFPQPSHTSSAWLIYKFPSFSAQAPPATEITTLEFLLSAPRYCDVCSPDRPSSPFSHLDRCRSLMTALLLFL